MEILLAVVFWFVLNNFEKVFWLVVPVSFLIDFWKIRALGESGLEILGIVFLMRVILGIRMKRNKIQV